MKPSMRRNLSPLVLFLFSQSFYPATAAPIDDVCNNLGGDYIQPSDCYGILRQDPRSAAADPQGLGIIALRLAVATAEAAEAKIGQLQKNAPEPSARKGLEACQLLYSSLVPILEWSAEAMKSKYYGGAVEVAPVATSAAAACDQVLAAAKGGNSPLSRENGEFTMRNLLSVAIGRYLQSAN